MQLEFFSADIRKLFKYQISWTSIQWEPNCSMRADGWTNRHDEANSRFSQICETPPKNVPDSHSVILHLSTDWSRGNYVRAALH